ncbi:O-antigen ligase family protein [Kistimonas asteriae]|uniref:O-antigen ligase family protein n=1 Tax=Kistimonas asteriae TaxID=517724 RepID=UPI001BA5E9A8|nr:O-antigen ligase family protein [Kistimonas asteriae]
MRHLDKADDFITRYLLPFGLFVQLTAITWLGKGGAISQTYVWLILPAFISALLKLRHFRHLKPGILEAAFFMFVAWAALSWFWSDTETELNDLLKRCLYVLLYVYAIVQCAKDAYKLEKLLLLATLVITISAAFALINHYIIQDHQLAYRSYRLFSMGIGKYGDFKHPINAGIFYGVYAVYLFTWLATRAKTKLAMTAAIIGISVLSFYVLMTWSRGPIIALITSFAVISIVIRNSKTNIALLVGALGVLFVAVNYGHALLSPKIFDTGMNNRTNIWQAVIELIRQSPLVGYGFEHQTNIWIGNWLVPHAHNLPLQMVLNYGLVGITLLIAMAVGMLLAIKRFWGNPLAKYAFALMLFGSVSMVSDVYSLINRPGEFWLITWLPLGLAIAAKQVHLTKQHTK